MTNTELCLNEISFRVGYENVDHFTKLFLRHVGYSPSEYRRQFKYSMLHPQPPGEHECDAIAQAMPA
ncbi:helix-turn-helix domain-containing protein [Martelella alba]|uniref:helix-turn-helix domain-containing protein n=1 Tax=Martelella alba TaxID=2590451 RepID=UPI001E3B9385|nr:helix-turn-helix domain-containing protein [Martelella alba]